MSVLVSASGLRLPQSFVMGLARGGAVTAAPVQSQLMIFYREPGWGQRRQIAGARVDLKNPFTASALKVVVVAPAR